MAIYTFNCPACGAPLDYKGGPETTVRCPFCNNDVVVPLKVRRRMPLYPAGGGRSRGGVLVVIFSAAVVLILGGVVFAILSANRVESDSGRPAANAARSTMVPPTPVNLATPVPTLAFAVPGLSFGEKGIGPGQLNDARYLAVDGSGTLYVADYTDDRVQAFDASGKYLNQFSVGDGQTIIHGMAADHQGRVFIAVGHVPDILEYNGKTGQPLGKLANPNGGEFGMLAATTGSSLAAAWYEGRWGIITSVEGHRDDLLLFDAQGKVTLTIPSFISAQTGDSALDNYIAVDGLGKIFALSDGVVYVFSPQGKYTDKFDGTGGKTMQYSNPGSICVDGQDRVYIGDTSGVHVYSGDGRLIADFPVADWVDSMVVDEQDNLWLLGGDKVTKYTLSGK
jgi:sugar lactone lactonase YvrE